MTIDVPDPWASAMIEAGCVDPRRKDDVASLNALGRRVGLSTETVRRLIRGEGEPEPGTLEKIAGVLGPNAYEWAERAKAARDTWAAPPEAAFLTEDEGQTITRLIRQMTEHRRRRPTKRSLTAIPAMENPHIYETTAANDPGSLPENVERGNTEDGDTS